MDTVDTAKKSITPSQHKGIGIGISLVAGAAAAIVALAVSGLVVHQLPGQAQPQVFRQNGFGKLLAGMTTEQAMATGELKSEPLYTSGGCTDHAYSSGSMPDLNALEAVKLAEATEAEADRVNKEKQAASDLAYKASREAWTKYSATFNAPFSLKEDPATVALRETWDTALKASSEALKVSAEASTASSKAASAARLARAVRTKATNDAGMVSLTKDGPRLIIAPAGVRTPEGIGRGSTVKELEGAYGASGLKADEGSFQLAVPGHANWVRYFHISLDKVYAFGLRNLNAKCAD